MENELAQTLSNTLTYEPNVRREAEEKLKEYGRVPGFASGLVRIVVEESVSAEIRMAAAVSLKNFVKKNWVDEEKQAPEVDIPNEEKEQIRKIVLEGMYLSKGSLQSQLSHTLHLLAKIDFPGQWPDLVKYLTQYLTGDNLEHLLATLSSLDQIFKKFRYESKSMQLWSELKECLLTVQQPLTDLFEKMVTYIAQLDAMDASSKGQWLEILNLITRSFLSLSSQDLPEYFEDNLKRWVEGFLQLAAIPANIQESSGGEPTMIDSLKSEICEIFTLYAQRYEEEIMPFMPNIIQTVWQLLVSTGSETRFDALVCSSLDFLAIICQKVYYETYFSGENVLQTIAQDICVKNLNLREEDIELFEDEPVDYMRKDLEGSDMGTRRRGAVDLVRGLCRRFEPQVVSILSQIIPTLITSGEWLKQDVVYCLVTAIASKGETAKSGVTSTSELINVADFFANQVRPHLTAPVNEHPILKADALKFAVAFRNQLSPQLLLEVIQATVKFLDANQPIVHKYAAYAIEKILSLEAPNKAPLFTSDIIPIQSLLTNLVAAFDKDPKSQNSAYLIKAVLKVVAVLDDSSAQAGGLIASKLCELIAATTKVPADPVHTHFLFETICVLITKTASIPSVNLEGELLPLIETILSQNLEDYIPYALQLSGVLLLSSSKKPNVPVDKYFAFLPVLLSPNLWNSSTNIPAIITVLETFLRLYPEQVFQQYSVELYTHYNKLIASKVRDQHGFQLAVAFLPGLEFVKGVENPVKTILTNMFKRIQTSKTSKFTMMFALFFAKFAILKGGSAWAQAIESCQTGMFGMVMEKVIAPEVKVIASHGKPEDKRTFVFGMAHLLADCATMMSADLLNALSSGITTSLLSYDPASRAATFAAFTPEQEQAAMYNAEGEFVNPYCRLSYAPKPPTLIEVPGNYDALFARAFLQSMNTVAGFRPNFDTSVLERILREETLN